MNFDNCNGLVYIIKKGDTLYSLSRRYNVPLALILRANPYVDIYNLQIGDELCIPVEQGQLPEEGPGPVMPPTPSLPGGIGNQPAAPGPGPSPLPMPSVPGNGMENQPAMPGPGPSPLPMPSVPGNGMENQPAMPGPGPSPLPMPSVPENGVENQPAAPGVGPYPLPTPSLPENGTENRPAMPGPGPNPVPMPSVPTPGIPCSSCHYHVIAYVIRDNDSIQDLLDYFNITLDDLLAFNQIGGIMLRPGMTIQIPKFTDN